MGKLELALIDHLSKHPITDAAYLRKTAWSHLCNIKYALSNLENAGFVGKTTGRKRNRMLWFQGHLRLFDDMPSTTPAIYDSEKPTGYQHGTDKPVEQEL